MAFQLTGVDRERIDFGNARTNLLLLGKRGGGMTATSRLHALLNFADGLAVMGGAWDVAGNFTVATNKLTVASDTGNTVIAGTLGVTGAVTLSSTMSCLAATIVGNSTVTGTFGVTGATTITGATNITGATAITGALSVSTTSTLTGNVSCGGTLGVTGATTLGSTCNVVSNFTVNTNKFTVDPANGNTVVAGTLNAAGAVVLAAGLSVGTTCAITGNATVGGTLGVTGAFAVNTTKFTAAATGALAVDVNKFTVSAAGAVHCASNFDVASPNFTVTAATGATHIAGDFDVATSKFTVAAATGNTVIGGTLSVPLGNSISAAHGGIRKIYKQSITNTPDANAHDLSLTFPAKSVVLNAWVDVTHAAAGALTIDVGYNGNADAFLNDLDLNIVAGPAMPGFTVDGTGHWLTATTYGASLMAFHAGTAANDPGFHYPILATDASGKKLAYQASGADAATTFDIYVEYIEYLV